LKINHYLYVDLKGFEGVVQALGGVDMCIPAENVNTPGWVSQEQADGSSTSVYFSEVGHIVDPGTGLDVVPGCQRLSPLQALAYVRSRHLPCDTFSDLNRIGRQQQFLHAVMNRLLQPSEMMHALSLIRPILSSLRRDDGLQLADLVSLVGDIKGISTGSVEFRTIPSTRYIAPDGQDALRVTPVAKQIFAAIEAGKALGNIGLTNPYTPPSPAQITVPVVDHSSWSNAQSVWQVLSDSGFNIAASPVTLAAYGKATSGNVIAYAPGHSVEADVVHQYLPGLSTVEVKGLPNDVAVYVTASYRPAQVAPGNNGETTSSCVGASG